MIFRRGAGHTFYVRLGVPRRLQALYGHKEVLRSLHTSSLEEAKVRALAVEQELRAALDRLERPATPLDPQTVADLYAQKVLADDMADRIARSVAPDAAHGDDEAESYALTTRLESLEDDPSQIHRLLDGVLFEHGLHVTPAHRAPYAAALLKAEVSVLKTMLARSGHFDAAEAAQSLGPTIGELTDAYLTDRKLPARTAHDIRSLVARCSQTMGGGLTRRARAVGRADVRRWRAAVLAWDRSPSTQKKALVALSTIWKFGLQAGLVDSNTFEGMTSVPSRGGTAAPSRLPYSPAQVRLLLAESSKLTGAKRWAVWLLAYSGARAEEVCGARARDVRQEQGVWVLDLEPTKDRRLKTRGSARKVPIHPNVLAAGFVEEYVKGLPADGQLWPDLPRQQAKGKYSVAFGRWFASWSGSLGHGLDDPRVVLHSLRGSFKRACRDAGIPEELHDQLTGHVTASVGRRYGLGASLKTLAAELAKVSYEEE